MQSSAGVGSGAATARRPGAQQEAMQQGITQFAAVHAQNGDSSVVRQVAKERARTMKQAAGATLFCIQMENCARARGGWCVCVWTYSTLCMKTVELLLYKTFK